MIRFVPDDWVDVVMRPLDMASPEANTYVEIAAPDVRLAAVLLLAAALLLLGRRRMAGGRPVLWLLALLLVSAAVWLATSGNGRYFITWLVLLGPLCVGLIRLLPLTAVRKLTLCGLLIGTQVFVLAQNSPWGSWTWAAWIDPPYFQLATPPVEPMTYVTIANISYSLVAPQFPAKSHWIGLGGGVAKRDLPVVNKLLASSRQLTLLAPAIPAETLDDGQPSANAVRALDGLLKPHGLLLQSAAQCQHLASGGLWRIAHRESTAQPPDMAGGLGFWLCPLEYRPSSLPPSNEVDLMASLAFEAIERLCPRFFPGGGVPMKINGGWLKHYDSDTKGYVMDDGTVYYKFWRSLNPVKIGKAEQLRAGQVSIDCSKIRAPNWRRGGP